jgi:hypothetical protein
MTTFAPHRETLEAFKDCMNNGADKDTFASLFAEDVVLHGPLGQERSGRDIVVAGSQSLFGRATSDKYDEVFSGPTSHAVRYRLQVGDAAIDGIYQALLNAEGKIAEVTIWWRTVPDAVELQRALAAGLGTQPWELRMNG